MRAAKKLLLLSQFSPPETASPTNRVDAMVRIMAEHYEVRVVTLKPSYPSRSLYKGFPLEHHDRALPFEVTRPFSFHPHKGGLLVRALREHVMALGLAGRAILMPADIVIATSPTMFLGPAALALARFKGARFVWDVRDVTWNYAKEVPKTSWVMALGLQALERYMTLILRQADLVVGATPGIIRVLIQEGLAPERVAVVPNGVSEDVLNSAYTSAQGDWRATRPKVVYAGVIGYNQGLGTLLEVAGVMPEVDFVLAGDGPELPPLKEQARKSGVTNVYFTGYLNKQDLRKVYAESNILFAKVRSTPTLDATSVPSKLFEYMAAGKPLVYGGRGIAVEFLEEVGCALTAPPEDSRAIAAAIEKLLHEPDMMRTLGGNGRRFVQQNYHRDKLMEGLVRELKARFG